VVCTQDPITNNEVNRLFEVLEALDFQAQELKNRKNKDNIYDLISKESIDILLVLAINNIKNMGKQTMLDPYPGQGYRFNIKL